MIGGAAALVYGYGRIDSAQATSRLGYVLSTVTDGPPMTGSHGSSCGGGQPLGPSETCAGSVGGGGMAAEAAGAATSEATATESMSFFMLSKTRAAGGTCALDPPARQRRGDPPRPARHRQAHPVVRPGPALGAEQQPVAVPRAVVARL